MPQTEAGDLTRELMMHVGQRFNPYKSFHGAFVPEAICKHPGLSAGAKLAYGRLCRYAGDDGEAYPSAGGLGREIGIGERQARRYLRELEKNRFLEVDRKHLHYHKDGGGGTCRYFFLWHPAFQTTPRRTHPTAVPVSETSTPARDSNDKRRESLSRESVEESQNSEKADISPGIEKHDARADCRPHTGNKTKKPRAGKSAAEGRLDPLAVKRQREPQIALDLTEVNERLAAFMDGEPPPVNLLEWISGFLTKWSLSVGDIMNALEAAWNRRAAPGKKNAPRSWNWFYEVLRNAFEPGYAARLPEQPAGYEPVSVPQTGLILSEDCGDQCRFPLP